ncbi:hypothetical protein CSA80_02385, partial [Candidatus Saccharibacteria bacterium]
VLVGAVKVTSYDTFVPLPTPLGKVLFALGALSLILSCREVTWPAETVLPISAGMAVPTTSASADSAAAGRRRAL